MIHAVLDGQALLSGIGWPTAPSRRLVQAALAGRVVPVTSPALLAELERALAAPPLRELFPEPDLLLESIEQVSLVVEPRKRLKVARFDPSNRLLEAAHAAEAGYVVTSDIELLRLGNFAGSKMVRPHPA